MPFSKRLSHLIKHPLSILPGSPNFVIDNIDQYIADQGLSLAGNDFIDGPNCALWRIDEPELINVIEPIGSGVKTASSVAITNPSALVYLKNASVLGPQGWVLDQDNGFFSELTHSDRKGINGSNSLFKRKRFPTPEKLSGKYVTLCYPYSPNWYHWLIQSLPRLKLIEKHLVNIDGVIVPESNQQQAILQSLEYFGIPENKICILGNRKITTDELFIPHYFSQFNTPFWVSDFFRSVAHSKLGEQQKKQRIYISRNDSSRRRCLNEDDLLNSLAEFNFEKVVLSELSFSDQVATFYNAEIVIGPHGAGLSHCLFCPPNASLVELLPTPDLLNPGIFHSIANAAKLKYYYYLSNNNPDRHSDFEVDTSAIKKIISQALRA